MATKWQMPVELGTLGINQYVHVECEPAFLAGVAADGNLPEPGRSKSWKPPELLGQFPDIVSCDHCGVGFAATDSGYTSFWVTTQEELDRTARGKRPSPWWKFW